MEISSLLHMFYDEMLSYHAHILLSDTLDHANFNIAAYR